MDLSLRLNLFTFLLQFLVVYNLRTFDLKYFSVISFLQLTQWTLLLLNLLLLLFSSSNPPPVTPLAPSILSPYLSLLRLTLAFEFTLTALQPLYFILVEFTEYRAAQR